MRIDAEFGIFSRADGRRISESELGHDQEALSALMENLDSCEGWLSIQDSSTGVSLEVGDSLAVLMGAFCFNLIALRQGDVVVDFFDHEEQIVISPGAESLCLSGDRFGRVEFERSGYVTALLDCGERYLHLIGKYAENHPRFAPLFEDLTERFQRQRNAILGANDPVADEAPKKGPFTGG